MSAGGKMSGGGTGSLADQSPRRFLGMLLAIGLFVHLLGFLLFRIDLEPISLPEAQEPFVVFIEPSKHPEIAAQLDESASLEDPSRLFLPGFTTQGNPLLYRSSASEPIRFGLIDPILRLGSGMTTEALPVSIGRRTVSPESLLEFSHWRIFEQVGRTSFALTAEQEPIPEFVETPVELSRMGFDGIYRPVDLSRLSEFIGSERRLTEQPLEMSFRIDDRGLVSPPVYLGEPASNAFSEQVLRWLSSPRNLAALEEGLYRLRVFP